SRAGTTCSGRTGRHYATCGSATAESSTEAGVEHIVGGARRAYVRGPGGRAAAAYGDSVDVPEEVTVRRWFVVPGQEGALRVGAGVFGQPVRHGGGTTGDHLPDIADQDVVEPVGGTTQSLPGYHRGLGQPESGDVFQVYPAHPGW